MLRSKCCGQMIGSLTPALQHSNPLNYGRISYFGHKLVQTRATYEEYLLSKTDIKSNWKDLYGRDVAGLGWAGVYFFAFFIVGTLIGRTSVEELKVPHHKFPSVNESEHKKHALTDQQKLDKLWGDFDEIRDHPEKKPMILESWRQMANDEKWREAFELFDRDGDGRITTGELGTVMRALGENPTQAEVAEIVRGVGGQSVDFGGFKALMNRHHKEVDAEKEMRDAFKVFDRDGKGEVSTQELRAVLTSMGEKLTEEEVDPIIRQTDKQGKIYLEDFISALLRPVKK